MSDRQINISTGIVFRTILIILSLWFLYMVRDVIVLLFISVILVSAMEPAVDFLQRKKIPRSVSVLGLYLLLLVTIAVAFSFLIPPITDQFEQMTENFPQYSQEINNFLKPFNNFISVSHINLGAEQIIGELASGISSLTQNLFSKTIGVFSGLISIVIVFSLAFYMSVEERGIQKFVETVVPTKYKKYAVNLTERIKYKIGKWMLGQIALMFLIFILDFIGLYLVGVPYALVLAIFAGILEIIPYVGPIISAIPGIVLGFLISPTTGMLAALVYLLSQQLESNVITPQVMKKAVGLNPIIVILALLIGSKIGGILGAVLAIPVATAIGLFIKDLMENREMSRG